MSAFAVAIGCKADIACSLIRRGKQWSRYDAPNKRLFKELQKILAAPD
jgi:hypothetical protein